MPMRVEWPLTRVASRPAAAARLLKRQAIACPSRGSPRRPSLWTLRKTGPAAISARLSQACKAAQVRGASHALRASPLRLVRRRRSEEHTSELQSLMRISYAVFCLKKKTTKQTINQQTVDQIRHEIRD